MKPPCTGTTTLAATLDLLDVSPQDRADCVAVVRAADHVLVRQVSDALAQQWGAYREAPPHTGITDQNVWLAAYIALAPTVAQRYRELGVPEAVMHATLADFGRQLRMHRQHHGHFGFETWDWLVPHFTGMMFALGRLNFALHRTELDAPGIVSRGDWVAGVHVPENGPLCADSVDHSLCAAAEFFAQYFPDAGVRWGVCKSWLLDPYLVDHIPDGRIAAYSRRFQTVAPPDVDTTAALYFVFRDRDVERIRRRHPNREMTSLQRLVVDRAMSGDPWRVVTGALPLGRAARTAESTFTLGAEAPSCPSQVP